MIATMALVLVAMVFIVIEHEIEQEFRVVIEERLQQAQRVVNQRMRDRFDRLYIQAVTVSESKLVQDIITDKELSRATSDDIARSEILPSLDMTRHLLVIDADGALLADASRNDAFWSNIRQETGFEQALNGSRASGLLVLNRQWLQWIGMPVFIGDQQFGLVIMASVLNDKKLEGISRLTGTELLTVAGKEYLVSRWQQMSQSGQASVTPRAHSALRDIANQLQQGGFPETSTSEVSVQGERYLLRSQVPGTPFTPTFVVAQSLDQALLFVRTIRQTMLVISVVALFIAIALGFMFAAGVSRPVFVLRQATRAVANEEFDHRVEIRTRDEFRELGESFNQMSASLAEKVKIRSALDKTVSREIADHLLQQGVELGGETREASILFTDIRGFTGISERLSEHELLDMLNHYFTSINACIQQHQGTIDKFIGDAVMALFGVPGHDERHAYHAVQAALEIVAAVDELNLQQPDQELHIGIGINSGRIIAGLMGSEDRLNYTVLGDQVNLASRVESLCKFYGASILLTEETRDQAIAHVTEATQLLFRHLDVVQVKGKTHGVGLYEPMTANDKHMQQLARYHEALELLFDRDFSAALSRFDEYLSDYPEDNVARRWQTRCQNYARSPQGFDVDYQNKVRIMTVK